VGLGSSLGLSTEVGGGAIAGEEAANQRLEEGVEDNLGTVGLGKSHPHHKDELEDVVEGEPVSGADSTLEGGQESKDDPVSQPLSVIRGTRGEQGLEGVVARKDETGKVDEELAGDVEEDKEEVDTDQTQDDIDLGNGGLSLQVVQDRVLRQLLVELGDSVLGTVLEGSHFVR